MFGLLIALTGTMTATEATVRKTTYPVVFAHGLAGWDNILGQFYFGDNNGNFVGDPCDETLEVLCNGGLNSAQKAKEQCRQTGGKAQARETG